MTIAVSPGPRATIVIPTQCNQMRADSLWRALRSVTAACSDPVAVVVVINGDQVDEQLLASISEWPNLTCVRIDAASVVLARAAGRRAVSTPLFGFLDDDDELLAGAVSRHLLNFQRVPSLDVSVCNGFRQVGANRELIPYSTAAIETDPLRALFHGNWLAPCGALFREATVGTEFFDDMPPHAQWTFLAFRLAMSGKQVRVVSEPGYVIHDSPVSLSKRGSYKASLITLYERMRRLGPPEDVVRHLHKRSSDAFHELSVEMLTKGLLRDAVRFHMKSLRPAYGLKYLGYTRCLIMKVFTRANTTDGGESGS